jgi:transposase-like protein
MRPENNTAARSLHICLPFRHGRLDRAIVLFSLLLPMARSSRAMNIDLTDPKFHDENAAREWFERKGWPDGVSCVHCGAARVARMGGKSGRPGLFHCPDCRGQFTVPTGHVMEPSHVPLTKWALAFHLMTASKKGVSVHQLHRTLKIAYNSAWFMEHRIREAMTDTNPAPLGGPAKILKADETYRGKRKTAREPSPQRKGRPYLYQERQAWRWRQTAHGRAGRAWR